MTKKTYLFTVIRWVLALAIAIVIWHLWSRRVWAWQPWNLAALAIAYAFALIILSSPEVFVIAFILAMIIRGFCIEVYKIPTGSMEPTLHGDPVRGDQILANKFSRHLESIHRFDVVLFRYPLNKTKNFIKRVVGLPNEKFMVENGNIYYCPQDSEAQAEQSLFYLAKKPLHVQESIWIPVWLWSKASDLVDDFDDAFQTTGTAEWQGTKVFLGSNDDSSGENLINYREPLEVFYNTRRSGVHYPVPEVKVLFKCQPSEGAQAPSEELGEIKIQLKGRLNTFIVHLGLVADSDVLTGSFLEHINYKNESRSETIDRLLRPGQEYEIALLNYDGTIYLMLDKEIILKYDYARVLSDVKHTSSDVTESTVSFGVVNAQALFYDINLYGDIYYKAKGVLGEGRPLNIPPDKYFVIGDNVGNSKDSRLWRMKRIYLKDGRVIECDADCFSESGDYINILRDNQNNKGGDIWGNEYKFKKTEIARREEIYYPFVSDEAIFGKALFVYWPLRRLKIVR